MPIETWLIFLIGFMIVGSIVALELKDILSSVVAIGIVGLAVSIAFLFLQAPDLAIVQFLFEIFALIILIRAFIKKDYHEYEPSKINGILSIITALALIAAFLFSIHVFQALPQFGKPPMEIAQYYLDNGAGQIGAANIVAAIILDYRAYDTLGETTILATAILGTITILRLRARKKEGSTHHE